MTEPKQKITFGKFQNVDMRVATILSAISAEGTRYPSRILELDLGELGTRRSVGQYALVAESDLVGAKVIACVNLGDREMGPYISEALVLGTHHPQSPPDQNQALPLWADPLASPGDQVF
jgi:tRNA-binding protein